MIQLAMLQGIAAAIVYGAAILVLLRALPKVEATFVALSTSMVTYAAVLAFCVSLGQTVNFWVFSTTYWFFALSFLMIFGAIYKSLSLRMLLTLLDKSGHQHSAEDFWRLYVSGESFQNRLKLIVEQGLAVRDGDKFKLSERGARSIRRVIALQRAFGIERSG